MQDLKVQRMCPLCGKDSFMGVNVGVTEKGDILQCNSNFSTSFSAKLLKPYKGKVKGMIIGKVCFKKYFNNSFENIDKIKAIYY